MEETVTIEKLTIQEINQYSPLALAYIGDVIYELLTREKVIARGNMPVHMLHKNSVEYVRASAQAIGYDAVKDMLTEQEQAIYKRGRNAEANVPKNASHAEYHKATGLEALFGYLYLLNDMERITALYTVIFEAINSKKVDNCDGK